MADSEPARRSPWACQLTQSRAKLATTSRPFPRPRRFRGRRGLLDAELARTHLRAIPGTLDTVPDTTTDSAHGERSSEVVKDDIRAVVSGLLSIGESPVQRYGADLEGGWDMCRRPVTDTNRASRSVLCASFAHRHRRQGRRCPLRMVWRAPLGIGGMSDGSCAATIAAPTVRHIRLIATTASGSTMILTTGRGCGRRETCWARVWGRWKGRRWKKVEHWADVRFYAVDAV